MKTLCAVACVLVLLITPDTFAQPTLFNEQGYRIVWLRSPTPESIEGAATLDVDELKSKMQSENPPALIDVLPLTWMGIWVETESHSSLPDAVWLPNVGRAELEPIWERYLSENLTRITAGDKSRELVIFCRADCWYSWNAVKRLVERGFTSLYWYRLGTDGWLEAGEELHEIHPQPMAETEQ